MKRFVVILFLFSTVLTKAQVKDSRINFALLYFDLVNEKLDFSDYELYLSAMIAIGDKSIVLEEIFKDILKSSDLSLEDSLFTAWGNDVTKNDERRINKLPKISDEFGEIPFLLVRISYMCEAYMKKTTLSDAYLNIMKDQPTYFPHLPKEASAYNSDLIKLVEKYYTHVVWFREYPEELDYFYQLIKKHAEDFYGDGSDSSIEKFVQFIMDDARERQSIDAENIPIRLGFALDYYQNLKRKKIAYADLCTNSTIDQFVDKAYLLIYGEAAPEEIKEELVAFIQTNDIYDPELIYLALILSYYE